MQLLAMVLAAQAAGSQLAIQLYTNGACLLTWPVTTNEQVVLSATNVAGPWQPLFEPVAETEAGHHVTVTTSHRSQYFRLIKGYHDDFEDVDLKGWTVTTVDPQAPTYLTWEATNGQLRIHGTWPGVDLERHVIFHHTNLMMADFTMSIDILGWNDGVPGDQPNIALMGGLWAGYLSFPDVFSYNGCLSMRHWQYPNLSGLYLLETWPGGYDVIDSIQQISKTDPAKDYRLEFSCIGDLLKVRLWELTGGVSLVDSFQFVYTEPYEGQTGFWVVVHGVNGNVDFTLDNFVVYATPP